MILFYNENRKEQNAKKRFSHGSISFVKCMQYQPNTNITSPKRFTPSAK